MYCVNYGNEIGTENPDCPSCVKGVESDTSDVPKNIGLPSADAVIEHLKAAKILEARIYELEQIINNLNSKINRLKILLPINEPNCIFDYFGIIGAGILLFVLCTTLGIYNKLLILAVVFLAVLSAIVIGKRIKQKKKYKSDIAVRDEQRKINIKKISVLKKGTENLTKTKIEAENCLKRIYDANIIFPKYRNMIAVTAMYEYFISERCSELAGHDGAYNMYENELRQNRYLLREAIHPSQSIIDGMLYAFDELSSNISSIDANAKISAYNSKIAAENNGITEYMNIMNL